VERCILEAKHPASGIRHPNSYKRKNMKTLAKLVKELDGYCPTKELLRAPKKFWRVDIECPDYIWRGYCTEKPTFSNLREIWEYEITEAKKQAKKCKSKFDLDVWDRRIDVAMDLLTIFDQDTGKPADVMGCYDFTIEEDVLY
jgi:hypothetical protein